jgi:hypothetical protein
MRATGEIGGDIGEIAEFSLVITSLRAQDFTE